METKKDGKTKENPGFFAMEPNGSEASKDNPELQQVFDLLEQLQAIGQAGMQYGNNDYDLERYQRIREISGQILAVVTEESFEKVKTVFLSDCGYQTPKMDTRAVVFNAEGKVLLVHEKDGRWALPGGWVDVGESVKSNTAKEAWEEAGARVKPLRLLAVVDKKRRQQTRGPFSVFTFFVECEYLGGEFVENVETSECAWFAQGDLPELATGKNNASQLAMCFAAHANPNWELLFD